MTVYNAGPKGWRYDFEAQGQRYTKAGFKTKAECRASQEEHRRQVRQGRSVVFSTCAELIDDFLQSSSRTKSGPWVYQLKVKLNKGFGHLATLSPSELKRGHIERTLNDLARSGLSARTVNEYRKIIIAVLSHGVRMEALERNPATGIAKMPEDAPDVQPIPTAYLQQLIIAAPTGLRELLVFLSQTGARWVEATRLLWKEVFLDGPEPFCVLTTRKQRGGHERKRVQVLTRTAVNAIKAMRGRSTILVFPGADGGSMAYQTYLNRLNRLADRIGVPRHSFHQIRHWTGMIAAQMGKSKKAVSEFLGQLDTNATERYLHAARPELWEVARQLESEVDLASLSGENEEKTPHSGTH